MRLWIRICQRSKVLVPSPHGDLRTVSFSFLVGMRTGPVTFKFFSRALFFNSAHTFSRAATFVEVRVIRMRWMGDSSTSAV